MKMVKYVKNYADNSFKNVSIQNDWFHCNIFIDGCHCVSLSLSSCFPSDPLPFTGSPLLLAFHLSVCLSTHPSTICHLPINLDSGMRRNVVFFFLTPPLLSLTPLSPPPPTELLIPT